MQAVMNHSEIDSYDSEGVRERTLSEMRLISGADAREAGGAGWGARAGIITGAIGVVAKAIIGGAIGYAAYSIGYSAYGV